MGIIVILHYVEWDVLKLQWEDAFNTSLFWFQQLVSCGKKNIPFGNSPIKKLFGS